MFALSGDKTIKQSRQGIIKKMRVVGGCFWGAEWLRLRQFAQRGFLGDQGGAHKGVSLKIIH